MRRTARARAVRARVARGRAVWRACGSRPFCSRLRFLRACGSRTSRKICEEENFFKFVLQNEGV
ncbi:hypothetical protein ACN6IQ_03705 [Fannyhessea vaginae]|uniref:hypothetical protein n=1 Tax=Fannyhessea vaginae TaxID=82135 RepID=UPI003B221970